MGGFVLETNHHGDWFLSKDETIVGWYANAMPLFMLAMVRFWRQMGEPLERMVRYAGHTERSHSDYEQYLLMSENPIPSADAYRCYLLPKPNLRSYYTLAAKAGQLVFEDQSREVFALPVFEIPSVLDQIFTYADAREAVPRGELEGLIQAHLRLL